MGTPTKYYQGMPGWPCTDGPLAQADFPGALCRNEDADLVALKRSEAKSVPSLRTTCTQTRLSVAPTSDPAGSALSCPDVASTALSPPRPS